MGMLFIGIWPAYALFKIINYPGLYHAQGVISLFVGSFAIGFLLTALPRFTGSFPATFRDVAILLTLIFGELYFLMTLNLAMANLLMVAKFVYILYFGFSRARNKTLVPPPSFVWIIFALGSVIIGGLGGFVAYNGWLPSGELVPVFKALVFRGFITSLFLAIGGRLMPFLTQMPVVNPKNQEIKNHLLAAIIFFGGLLIDSYPWSGSRWGYLLESAALIFEIGYLWGLFHLPGQLTRSRLLWVSSWLLSSGPLFSFLWPALALHLMHLTFIGCFFSGTLLVASHVVVSHKDLDKKLLSHFWPLGAVWLLIIMASLTRATATMADYVSHLGYAGLTAIIGLLIWAGFFARGLFVRSP